MEEWKPSPEGWICLNFDGSSMGNPGQAGIGGTFRDHTGNTLLAYSGPIGQSTSNMAEARALLAGIKIYSTNFSGPLRIEGDSALVIGWSTKGSPPWKLRNIFYEITELTAGWQIQWSRIPRSANSLADKLAKEGVTRAALVMGTLIPII
ncbi:hypothetical protein H6P81_019475 [Aristolochia fimbriata]|uniref:RNase H type-1 domain-containing protein n=1 Tax=Aristolochia fimbriata TaxID=158543 RepID=A0AAV7DRT0_ARIFI|nr:hypothetical protein H6P81_019475 [Aristolochia fimbriata]